MTAASRILVFILTALFLCVNKDAWAAEDILSVDKTLIIQIIIFVVAIFILNSLLFKPLLELLGRREKLTSGTIEEAKQLGEKVEKIIDEYRMKLNEARTFAMEERNEIRRHAQTAYEHAVKKAREESQALVEESKVKLQSETKEIKEKVHSDIAVLARDMASRILGKEI